MGALPCPAARCCAQSILEASLVLFIHSLAVFGRRVYHGCRVHPSPHMTTTTKFPFLLVNHTS